MKNRTDGKRGRGGERVEALRGVEMEKEGEALMRKMWSGGGRGELGREAPDGSTDAGLGKG